MSGPPTHGGVLLQRRKVLIQKYFPDFFTGDCLLDIGFCKGGFIKLGTFKERVGIDKVDYGERIPGCQHHIVNFRDYYSVKQFDKIFVGNVGHYLFLGCGGWECLAKLAALSCGDVLVEGPKATECGDTYRLIPKDSHEKFNTFLTEMNKYFDLVKIIPTISYTPDRYFMLFRKKPYEVSKHSIQKSLRTGVGWYEIHPNHVTIELASYSPISNGFNGFTNTGWVEPKLTGTPYCYFENETKLLKLICDQGIFLAKNGYIDIDSATINFMRPSNLYFDKGGVRSIKCLQPTTSSELFSTLFYQSYNQHKIPEAFIQALESKDSYGIEEAWTQWRKML